MVNGRKGGQKQKWHDVINSDLKSLNLISNWRIKANDRKKWRKVLDRLLKTLNQTKEQIEKDKLDCKKNNDNSENTSLTRYYNNCNEVCFSKAGLANHIHQSHSEKSKPTTKCCFCHRDFKRQGIFNHQKKCEKERKNLTFLSATT